MREGVANVSDVPNACLQHIFSNSSLKIYDFFKDDFFGIESALAQIVRYFHSAALHGEESRQVLYLMGPVGAGKSSIIDKLQCGLEGAKPIYTIEGARCVKSHCT